MVKKITIGVLALAALSAFVFLLQPSYQMDARALEKKLHLGRMLYDKNRELPDFSLTDQHHQTFNNASLKGRWSLIFFGYTHCPDICPTGLFELSKIQSALAQKIPTEKPQVIFVTLDPERDTAEKLRTYLAHFDTEFLGLSGDHPALLKFIKPFGAYYEKAGFDGKPLPENLKMETANYLVNHTAWIYVMSPDGRLFAGFSTPHIAEKMAADIITMVRHYDQII